MTRDEIMHIANDTAGAYWMDEAHIQRFAAALLAAERERIIAANAPEIERINAELSEWKKFPMAAMLAAEKAVDAAIALEREACAVAVRFADNGTEAAEIIRARGEK